MKQLDEHFKNGSNLKVLSRDVDNGIDEWCEVVNSGMTNNDAETIKITDENGNYIICTPEHLVWTENRGYVKANDLVESDELKILDLVVK